MFGCWQLTFRKVRNCSRKAPAKGPFLLMLIASLGSGGEVDGIPSCQLLRKPTAGCGRGRGRAWQGGVHTKASKEELGGRVITRTGPKDGDG